MKKTFKQVYSREIELISKGISVALGLVLANNSLALVNSIIDSVIMPTLRPILKLHLNDHDLIFKTKYVTYHLDELIKAVVKFCVVLILVFFSLKLGVRLNS